MLSNKKFLFQQTKYTIQNRQQPARKLRQPLFAKGGLLSQLTEKDGRVAPWERKRDHESQREQKTRKINAQGSSIPQAPFQPPLHLPCLTTRETPLSSPLHQYSGLSQIPAFFSSVPIPTHCKKKAGFAIIKKPKTNNRGTIEESEDFFSPHCFVLSTCSFVF